MPIIPDNTNFDKTWIISAHPSLNAQLGFFILADAVVLGMAPAASALRAHKAELSDPEKIMQYEKLSIPPLFPYIRARSRTKYRLPCQTGSVVRNIEHGNN